MADIYTLEELASYLQIPFTELNVDSATLFRELTTIEIRNVVGPRRFDLITDVTVFRPVAFEMSKRCYINPSGVRTEQESIDDYNRSVTYAVETAGNPEFTAVEERRIRRAAGIRRAFTFIPGGSP